MSGITSSPDLLVSGGTGVAFNSARAGYLPVPLAHVPAGAFRGIPVYLRVNSGRGAPGAEPVFSAYRAEGSIFTSDERNSLLRKGIELVYIPMVHQARFRAQVETEIVSLAADAKTAVSARAAIVYETGVELINELLASPEQAHFAGRIEGIARAMTTVVLNDPSAFSHLFTASHHDFYTATHMINVATFIVPLAHALGYRGAEDLSRICQAGLLHDIGKLYVPENVLNKPGQLSEEDWWLLRRHAELGASHLEAYAGIDPLVATVAREHHERLDGSGYPRGLRGDEVDTVSKICAVVDSFDAMTALRPFKKRTMSVDEALNVLRAEADLKYDAEIVEAWAKLLETMGGVPHMTGFQPAAPMEILPECDQRESPRYSFSCPARLHVLGMTADGEPKDLALQVVAHNISQCGMGVLSQIPVRAGERVRVYLLARAWQDEYLEGQTVRCRGYDDGWYEIGMRFNKRGLDDRMRDSMESLGHDE